MKKLTAATIAIIANLWATVAFGAYTQPLFGIDMASSPFPIAIKVNNIWRNFAQMTNTGQFIIPTINGTTTMPYTGYFWPDYDLGPVNYLRNGSRTFLGIAENYTGNFYGDEYPPIPYWILRDSTALSIAQKGRVGFVGAARRSDADPFFPLLVATIGSAGIATCDSVVFPPSGGNCFAGYFEAFRSAGVGNTAFGMEIDAGNDGVDIPYQTPYTSLFSGAIGLNIAAGGSAHVGTPYANPSTSAIVIADNTQTFNHGIVFGATSLTGTDGITGFGYAMVMARGHIISWRASDNTGDGANILSTVTNVNNRVAMTLGDNFVSYANAGRNISTMEGVASAVNYLRMINSATGVAPEIAVAGTDADISLNLRSKGTGVIAARGNLFGDANITATANLIARNIISASAVPVASTCGTTPVVDANSTNISGNFTTGTGSPTACTLTFANAYPTAASCVVTAANAAAVGTTVRVSAPAAASFTITLGAGTSSASFNYVCLGK